MKLYSFFDIMADSFTPPLCYTNDEEFVRFSVDHVLRDGKTLISTHPEDFRLFSVGEFDMSTGIISGPSLTLVGDLLPFVRSFTDARKKENNIDL